MDTWFTHGSTMIVRLLGPQRRLATFADRVLEINSLVDVRLRPGSVTLRIHDLDAPSAAAHVDELCVDGLGAQHGLTIDPTGFREFATRIHCTDVDKSSEFWVAALGLEAINPDELIDLDDRSPQVHLVALAEPRPARSRIHLDLGAPLDSELLVSGVLAAGGRKGVAPWSHCDADGTEVDLIGREDPHPDFDDWVAMFTGVVRYLGDRGAVRSVVSQVSAISAEANFPVAIDVQPQLDLPGEQASVVIDVGKDRWMEEGFAGFATRVQQAARAAGLASDPEPVRFLQYGIDATAVEAVRSFWEAALGWQRVPDPQLTDLLDPELTGPSFIFQDLEPDLERSAQPNRVELEVSVAPGCGQGQVDAALAVGGRLVERSRHCWTLADPENNLLHLKELHWVEFGRTMSVE